MPATQLYLRLQSKVLPEVFLHPIWFNYIENNRDIPQQLILDLLDSAHQHELKGEIICCCQIHLMCACLYTISNFYTAALENIDRAWYLANTYNLLEIARYSAWGASSVSFNQGDISNSIHYLDDLERQFLEIDDWISASVIDLIKKSLHEKSREREYDHEFTDLLEIWGTANKTIESRDIPERDITSPEPEPALLEKMTSVRFMNISRIWTKLKRKSIRFFLRHLKDSSNIDQGNESIVFPTFSQRPELQKDDFSPPQHQIAPKIRPSYNDRELPGSIREEMLSKHAEQTLQDDRNLRAKIPSRQKHSMTVYCLGPFRIYQNDRFVENWTSRKGLSVFKYLVLEDPKPVAKDILMDRFWPEADPEAARRNLHQAIYAIRQTLKANRAGIQPILFENDAYLINPEVIIWIDCKAFEDHVKTGHQFTQNGDIDKALFEYSIAESLYQGDFMTEDLYEPWLQSRRQHLSQTYILIAHRLADYNLKCGNYLATSVLCRRILEMDNCQEEAHRNLIKCYLAQDQRQLAISQYHICVQNLKSELELPPSAETKALFQHIVSSQ